MSINVETAVRNLEDARLRLDMLRAEMQKLINAAIPQSVKDTVEEIEAEYADRIAEAERLAKAAEADAKAAVIQHGATVKGEYLQVIWMNPRVTWNAQALDGYALNHPELFAFRTEGAASASVRALK